jgi:putative aldouronate transport system substrate-binding protein
MCSEEMSVMTRYGEKGVDWKEPAPGDKAAFDSLGYPAKLIPIAQWGVLQNKWYGQTGPHMLSHIWNSGAVVPPGTISVYTPLGRSMGPVVEVANKNRNPVVGLIYNEQEQQIIDELHVTILNYVRESWSRFVTGDLNLDRDWDSYVAEFDKMRLRDVITAAQSAWDRMNK